MSHRFHATHACLLTSLIGLAGAAQASEALAKKAGCIACHAVDKKIVGPSYKDVAAKYRSQPGAAALVAARVRKGSQGVWGPLPMPATDAARLSDAELKALTAWVLKGGA